MSGAGVGDALSRPFLSGAGAGDAQKGDGFSSVVALQLHKLETRVRFPPPTQNRRDWWLSSVTLLLGDKDIWMVLVT